MSTYNNSTIAAKRNAISQLNVELSEIDKRLIHLRDGRTRVSDSEQDFLDIINREQDTATRISGYYNRFSQSHSEDLKSLVQISVYNTVTGSFAEMDSAIAARIAELESERGSIVSRRQTLNSEIAYLQRQLDIEM